MQLFFFRSWCAPFLGILMLSCAGAGKPSPRQPGDVAVTNPVHTQMTLYMMATCPHCARALNEAILPLYHEMNGALSLKVEYVGTLDEQGVPDLAHGENEVASAMVELCAANVSDAASWLNFMTCLYRDNTWRDVTLKWQTCAVSTKIPVDDVDRCVKAGAGRDALMRSIATSAAEGIRAAPTIFIDGREFVAPVAKKSLLTHICYFAGKDATRPKQCDTVEKPKSLKATVLTDVRCGEKCDIAREMGFVQALFPAMEIAELDYSEPMGKKMYNQMQPDLGSQILPLMFIEQTMEDLGEAAIPLARYMVEYANGFVLPLGEGFDPTAEICDNGEDDDANEQMDCEDSSCSETLSCRPEVKNRLDLFIMSQCPFAAMMIPAVDHVVKHLQSNGSSATVRFQFIGREIDGTLYSMHGKGEVDEDLRMACIQDLYPENHSFMGYMMCRAADYENGDWQKCVSSEMKVEDIGTCATGAKGYELLLKSFQLADAVERNGSPTWLLNNRLDMNARTATDIFAAYCAANDDPACNTEIKPLLIDKAIADEEKCE
ncbi:MAG: thioredoxin domain-containing protein [Deltaproteobacteria bacterium]|nr:thioredoxin domain-containing protein [Deltaproteobacteria bacterium]